MVTIDELRQEIEQIDAAIIEKIAQRLILARQIGQLKIAEARAIDDTAREAYLFQLYEQLSDNYQIAPAFIKQLFGIIIDHSKQIQAWQVQ